MFIQHDNYDQAEYDYFRTFGGAQRLDDNASIFLARELDHLRARIFEAETPALNALSIFPVQSEAAEWEKTITYGLISDFGMARIISDYSDDIPMVGIYGAWETVTIYRVADGYQFSMEEIQAAQAKQKNLDGRLAMAARRGCDAKVNDLAFNGDADYNIIGLLQHPNITKLTSAGWKTTTGANARTAGAIAMDELIACFQVILAVTKGLYQANRVVLPISAAAALAQQLPNTSISYKSFLAQEYPGLTYSYVQELEDIGAGKRGALVFVYDADCLAIEISQPFRAEAAQWNNYHAKTVCSLRTAGMLVYKPTTIVLVSGI